VTDIWNNSLEHGIGVRDLSPGKAAKVRPLMENKGRLLARRPDLIDFGSAPYRAGKQRYNSRLLTLRWAPRCAPEEGSAATFDYWREVRADLVGAEAGER